MFLVLEDTLNTLVHITNILKLMKIDEKVRWVFCCMQGLASELTGTSNKPKNP